jgi:hypothetical protein
MQESTAREIAKETRNFTLTRANPEEIAYYYAWAFNELSRCEKYSEPVTQGKKHLESGNIGMAYACLQCIGY